MLRLRTLAIAALTTAAAAGCTDPVEGQISGFTDVAFGLDGSGSDDASDAGFADFGLNLDTGPRPDGATIDAGTPDVGPLFGIVLTSSTVTIAELETATVGVSLDTMPAGPVQVVLLSFDSSRVTVTPATLTFTSTTFGMPQTATITGANDADTEDDTVSVVLRASGHAPSFISVTVTDADIQAIVASPLMLSVVEGMTTTIDVNLAFAPSATYVVTASTGDPTIATTSPTALSFEAADFSTQKTLTIRGTDDADGANDSTTMTLSAPGVPDVVITVMVMDDDVLAIAANPTMIALSENGTSTLAVSLTQAPPNDVTVSLVSAATEVANIDRATLVFNAGNFSTPQNVQVTAPDDLDDVDGQTTITLSAGGLTSVTVPVVVTDDDTQLILTNVNRVTVDEGATQSLTARLSVQPAANVTVSVQSSDTDAVTVSATTLTFTTADWNTPQTIVVSGVQDADAVDTDANITLSAANVPDVVVAVSVTDDDTQSIVVSVTMLTVAEGATGMVGVNLAAQPTANVVVAVASSNPAAATVTPATLTFTTTDFATQKNVTISGTQDVNATDEMLSVSLTSVPLNAVNVAVTVTDDDNNCPAPGGPSTPAATFSFFATSVGNAAAAGNYGGLAGADARCQCLADAVGAGARTWRAYLSTSPLPMGGGGTLVHARDRIGAGPWFNYSGTMIAADLNGLHNSPPPNTQILDEYGNAIPRAEHDILTGTKPDGTAHEFHPAAGAGSFPPNCDNWTDDTGVASSQPGHPDRETTGGDWNDAGHDQICSQAGFQATSGSGRLYCFAIN